MREVLGLHHLRGFAEIAPQDRGFRLTRALHVLARLLNDRTCSDWRLAVDEAVHDVLAGAFARHGRIELRAPGQEPSALVILRERIAAGVAAGESLTLDDLAAEAGLHPSYLVRSIARATGMTPHAHVIQHRVSHARRLLLDGVPAGQAAIAAGFCDQVHLIRRFRRHFGVTPGALIRH